MEQKQEATSDVQTVIKEMFRNMSFTDGGHLQNLLLPSMVTIKQTYSSTGKEELSTTKISSVLLRDLKKKKGNNKPAKNPC